MPYVIMKSDWGYKVVDTNKAPESEHTLDDVWYAGTVVVADSPSIALAQGIAALEAIED